MRLTTLVVLTLTAGCAHVDVSKGLDVAQNGMAVVDVGVDVLTDDYVEAVTALRNHCDGDAECEEKFKVTDEDVSKVTEALESLSTVYDQTAELLKTVGKTWGQIEGTVKQVKESADAVRE